ncbi:hypothetical protein [Luteolibacter sp. LG18]|uniref:hypothetical protein n=1 Tax=Luteolibacter sp. LG18 TaxID=2819286 RepID=UPI002B2AD18C|nr:hypothetical protein llg_11330 [Luteolibacter sp. LG18]
MKTCAYYLAFLVFLTGWPGGWELLSAGAKFGGTRGVMTALSFTGGAVGFVLGVFTMNLLQIPAWQFEWTPGDVRALRRIRLERGQGWLVAAWVVLATVVSTCTVMHGGWLDPVPASLLFLAAVCLGALFGGGKWSARVMLLTASGAVLASWVQGFISGNRSGFATRLLPKLEWAWPPGWVFQARGGGWFLPLAGVMVALGSYEWCRVWRPSPVESGKASEESGHTPDGTPVEETAVVANDMRDLRMSVAHGWIGLQGYVGQPAQWPDQWLWRWLTPRERLLACPGGGFASQWWRLARFAGLVPVVAFGGYRVLEHTDFRQAGETFAGAVVAGFCAIALTIGLCWPGRNSVFRTWFSRWSMDVARTAPAYALFPVTVRELLRATVKQWLVRSVPAGLVWFAGALLGVYAWLGEISQIPVGRLFFATLALCAMLLMVELQNLMIRSLDKQRRGFPALLATLLFCVTVLTGLLAVVVAATGSWPWVVVTAAMAIAVGFAGFGFSLWRVEGRGRDLL